ncbi:MAG TPA: NADPH-dependent assimilatory sulfite reductase hemoprotein subunit [Gemmatimonadales bacterium]|jgi:sulfite reductase (ferredoxin)|nr:NADPH-dependent assimilatory sulfite reductase hemoprotein subunit [Gemmatimonadales bacterium]
MADVEKVKEASRGLRGALAQELAAETSHFEDDTAQLLKFHGAYQQDDRDTRRARSDAGDEPAYSFMVRCKIPGGVLTAEQYLALDRLAGRYGNGTLRITTRQDNQFHGVLKGDLKATIRALNDALVTTLGACGDVQRNVVCCPAPVPGGLRNAALDAARRISAHLLPRTRAYHEIWLNGERVGGDPPAPESDPVYGERYLPRKFKTGIAFPDDNCTDVYSNDLGFVVIADGDRIAGFNVLVGGGLGMTHGKKTTYPRLADALGFVAPDEIVEVAEAVVTVQRDYGNRRDRRHARLKYLLEARGLEWFRGQVEARLGRPMAPPAAVRVTDVHDHLGWHDQGDGRAFYGLFVENGRIADAEAVRLRSAVRRIVEDLRPGVHFTPQQNLLFTGIADGQRATLEALLADHGVPALDAVSTVRRWSMACPALPTCGLALAEAERALPGVIDDLECELARLGLADERLTVRMTGCPNGCARPYTADLAFVGRSADKYTIFVGGNLEGTRLAVAYADLVPRDRLVVTVRPLLERYRAERLPGEGFGDFCRRIR